MMMVSVKKILALLFIEFHILARYLFVRGFSSFFGNSICIRSSRSSLTTIYQCADSSKEGQFDEFSLLSGFFASARANNAAKSKALEFAHRSSSGSPAVILVRATLDQNIGAVARTMLNFGLTELRLVDSRCDHLSEAARARASGADSVLEQAQIFQNVQEAVKDLHKVFATSARQRGQSQVLVTPRLASQHCLEAASRQGKSGFLFGTESSGLSNEELDFADTLVHIPSNPFFSSLNLAQAVNIVAYELYFSRLEHSSERLIQEEMNFRDNAPLATKEGVSAFLTRLENVLDKKNFQANEQRRAIVYQNIRNIFMRSNLSTREISTLHGIITVLTSSSPQSEE